MSIEEPFSILALESICESALTNIRELQSRYSTQHAMLGRPLGPEGTPQLSALRMVEQFGSGGVAGVAGVAGVVGSRVLGGTSHNGLVNEGALVLNGASVDEESGVGLLAYRVNGMDMQVSTHDGLSK